MNNIICTIYVCVIHSMIYIRATYKDHTADTSSRVVLPKTQKNRSFLKKKSLNLYVERKYCLEIFSLFLTFVTY